MTFAEARNNAVALGGLALALATWYALRKVGNVAEKAIDAAVETGKDVAAAPIAVTNPETYGLRDASTTVGTRAWMAKQLSDLGSLGAPLTDTSDAPDLTFNQNSDIPGVL